MSRTLLLMLGMGLWMVSPSQAADKPETVNMPQPVAGAEPAGSAPAAECCGHEPRCGRLRCCLGNLKNWLCYRDTQQPCKPELCPGPCCYPQLHTFFLHHCAACVEDDQSGTPITFSYTDLLERNGDSHCGQGGCGGYGCRSCK